jgi:hypothetical protein
MATEPEPHPSAETLPAADLAPRQCGRCRQLFDADTTLNAAAIPEWWLCAPCRTSLLGSPLPR